MRRAAALLVFCALLFPLSVQAQQAQSAPPATPPSTSAKPPTPQDSSSTQGSPDIQVWVNTKSGIYHCPGTHWYGATKTGEYMKQSEAQQKGFRPAYHKVCR